VYGTHISTNSIFAKTKCHAFTNIGIKEWIGITAAADYVISVDTGTLHLAGGLNKPMLGIFTYIDGKVRGCYYDMILIQMHRDNGDWPCGPCWNTTNCIKSKELIKPCCRDISKEMLADGIDKMFNKWPRK
jgi:ADP-heptose:LPS heptosyltransferase